MAIVGIRLRSSYQICYVDIGDISIKMGCHYIVGTEHGVDIGRTFCCSKHIDDEDIEKKGTLVRESTSDDLKQLPEIETIEKKAFDMCKEKVKKRNLDMKLISVKCLFDKTKLIFFFVSEERVDFRELVKDLAAVFRTRIEMRQIGVRDEARLDGGFGLCGREFCCFYLKEVFDPVSIKMAKEQNINLNSIKISGMCGRLICCLGYEYDVYRELNKGLPAIGTKIEIGDREYTVEMVDTLKGIIGLKDGGNILNVTRDKIEWRDGKLFISPDTIESISNLYKEEQVEEYDY